MPAKKKGINIVLHGPSGFGKTMTATALAEHLKRPQYTLRPSDLELDAASMAQTLDEFIEATHSWNAILLVDAADVYLEARQIYDPQHSSILTTFLRFMERHQGVLILTTDRWNHFDHSVLGHVHMGLRLDSPNFETRRKIWKQQLTLSGEDLTRPDVVRVPELNDEDLDSLSKRELSGRQVSWVLVV
jgi:SpoVK/Ycf46/Vps4 family AAA+-type ATPase